MAQEFEAVIAAILGQDDGLRQQAEAAIEQCKTQPDAFVVLLAQLLQGSHNPQVRVLSGVLLRQVLHRGFIIFHIVSLFNLFHALTVTKSELQSCCAATG